MIYIPATVNISIEFEDKLSLEAVYQSIKVETEGSKIKRGSVSITTNDLTLDILILGDDLVATRGLTNSILRLAATSVSVMKSLD